MAAMIAMMMMMLGVAILLAIVEGCKEIKGRVIDWMEFRSKQYKARRPMSRI